MRLGTAEGEVEGWQCGSSSAPWLRKVEAAQEIKWHETIAPSCPEEGGGKKGLRNPLFQESDFPKSCSAVTMSVHLESPGTSQGNRGSAGPGKMLIVAHGRDFSHKPNHGSFGNTAQACLQAMQ